jgi:hypothetical protein
MLSGQRKDFEIALCLALTTSKNGNTLAIPSNIPLVVSFVPVQLSAV